MADLFSRGGKPEGPTETEAKELHAKIGRLAVSVAWTAPSQFSPELRLRF